MCNRCRYYGCWLRDCSDRRGPGTPSPPISPPRLVPLTNQPAANRGGVHTNLTSQSQLPSIRVGSSASNAPANLRGSSIRSHASGQSNQAGSMVGSNVSGVSIDSAATINSVHSLQSLARHISADLREKNGLAQQLRARIESVESYRPLGPWPKQVQDAYNDYKAQAKDLGVKHTAFVEYMAVTNNKSGTLPEQHLERARMAVVWGEAAVRAAEGRLEFIQSVQNAYSSKQSVLDHIKQAETHVASGRASVAEARRNYNEIFVKFTRQANPQVFA